MNETSETTSKLKNAVFFVLDLVLLILMLLGSVFFLGKHFTVRLPEEKPVLYEKKGGFCPETFHVAIRNGFFEGNSCILGIGAKRKLSKEDLRVEPFEYHGRKYGRIEITEDPSAAPGADGVWNLLFKIDFAEKEPASFSSRIDPAGKCPWVLERAGTNVVIHINPAAREYVTRAAIPVCKGFARRDILCAERDDPEKQAEAIRTEKRSAIRLLMLCCAAFCIVVNLILYFKWWSRSPDSGRVRAFGKQWSVFMLSVVLAFSVYHIVHLLVLRSESLFRAGFVRLSDLQGMYLPVNISMAAGIAVAAGLAIFLLIRRKRRGPEAHLLPWLPLLCVAAVTCLVVRNQFARHYFRERFRAVVYQTEDAESDAEPDPFAEARREFEP
jgi:hypothetical protein